MSVVRKILLIFLVALMSDSWAQNQKKEDLFQKELHFYKSRESLYQAHLKPIQDKSSKVFDYVLELMSKESQTQLAKDSLSSTLVKLDVLDQKILMKKILEGFKPHKKDKKNE